MPTDPRKKHSVALCYLSRITQVYELAFANEQLCCNFSFSKPTRVPGKPFCPKVPGGPCLPLGPWSKDKIKIQPIFTELHNFFPCNYKIIVDADGSTNEGVLAHHYLIYYILIKQHLYSGGPLGTLTPN